MHARRYNSAQSIRQRTLQCEIRSAIGKRGSAEAWRAEAARRVVGKTETLGRLAEQAGRELRLIVLGMEERNGIIAGRDAAEHAGGLPIADRRDHAAPF